MSDAWPLLTLQISAQRCNYVVLANDVPVIREQRGFAVTVEVPVNHVMFSGRNTLEVILGPAGSGDAFDPAAECSATLRGRAWSMPREASVVLTTLSCGPDGAVRSSSSGTVKQWYRQSEGNDVVVGDADVLRSGVRVSAKRGLTMALPLPTWRWQSADPVLPDESTRRSLLGFYEHIWSLLEARRSADLNALFRERSTELATAFGRPLDEMERSLRFETITHDSDWRLSPLMRDVVLLEVFGDGRLARLVLPDGAAPIRFASPNRDLTASYEFLARREGSGWVISR